MGDKKKDQLPMVLPHPGGAPRTHDRAALLHDFLVYISAEPIPILAEWAARHGLWRQRLYEWPEFADAIKLCMAKKEGGLERGGLNGTADKIMAIFSLKQLGWRDKPPDADPNVERPAVEITGGLPD